MRIKSSSWQVGLIALAVVSGCSKKQPPAVVKPYISLAAGSQRFMHPAASNRMIYYKCAASAINERILNVVSPRRLQDPQFVPYTTDILDEIGKGVKGDHCTVELDDLILSNDARSYRAIGLSIVGSERAHLEKDEELQGIDDLLLSLRFNDDIERFNVDFAQNGIMNSLSAIAPIAARLNKMSTKSLNKLQKEIPIFLSERKVNQDLWNHQLIIEAEIAVDREFAIANHKKYEVPKSSIVYINQEALKNVKLPYNKQLSMGKEIIKILDFHTQSSNEFIRRCNQIQMLLSMRDTRLKLLTSAAAIYNYKNSHSAFPPNLQMLNLGNMQIDPCSGKPFIYSITKQGFILYAIGPDGKDNHGMSVNGLGRDNLLNSSDRPLTQDILLEDNLDNNQRGGFN